MAIGKRYSKKAGKYLWGFYERFKSGNEVRRVRIYTFETRRQAEEALRVLRRREREEQFGLAPQIDRPRLADLVERRLPTIERRAERVRAERVLRQLVAILPAGILLDQLVTAHLQQFVERRQADGQAAASINRELNIIGATLHAAGQFFPAFQQWRAPRIPRPKVGKSRRERILTEEEYRALLAWLRRPPGPEDAARRHDQATAARARERVAGVLECAMLTGARPGEIYALRWSDVDWAGERVRIRGTKTDSVRHVPLSAPLRDLLAREQARPDRDSSYIWTRGGQVTPKIYRILREACEAAGIQYGNQEREGFVLHCARHTFATRLLQAGVDLRTVGVILGHSDSYMTLHYSHVTPASEDRARRAIEAMHGGERKSAGEASE